MIATSGDETFLMLSMIPEKAPLIFVLLLCIGLAAGYLTDALYKKKAANEKGCSHEFDFLRS